VTTYIKWTLKIWMQMYFRGRSTSFEQQQQPHRPLIGPYILNSVCRIFYPIHSPSPPIFHCSFHTEKLWLDGNFNFMNEHVTSYPMGNHETTFCCQSSIFSCVVLKFHASVSPPFASDGACWAATLESNSICPVRVCLHVLLSVHRCRGGGKP
jgi:hypothetical protein